MLITYLKLSQVKSIPHGPFLPNQCAAYLQICCLICTDLKLNNKILLQEQKAEKDGGADMVKHQLTVNNLIIRVSTAISKLNFRLCTTFL